MLLIHSILHRYSIKSTSSVNHQLTLFRKIPKKNTRFHSIFPSDMSNKNNNDVDNNNQNKYIIIIIVIIIMMMIIMIIIININKYVYIHIPIYTNMSNDIFPHISP